MAEKLATTDTVETPKKRACGTMQVHQRLLRTNPAYARARIASENHHLEFRARRAINARTGVTVIPVVVHVVYKTPQQNIPDAQIHSQIDVLNRDFRFRNTDASGIPAAFKPLAGDGRVEFALATTDPSGNPTSGITRTPTNRAGFTDDDAVKRASSGGADAWPASKYLNIWVCQLDSLLGYAQFPGGPAETDGVVILHSGFGTSGTAAAPFDLGRTTTHEVGHWLNLRHIWGDDGNGCNGSDFVNDTPNQAGPNYGAPVFPRVTCSNDPSGDMFVNFMDYVDDAAMLMFSKGQVERMQACLDGDRSTIGTPKPGVAPPSLKYIDEPTDVLTLKFKDENPATLKFLDEPHQSLKFRDDFPPKLKFLDDFPQGSLKFKDDVKLPALDKSPAQDVFDGGWWNIFGPFGRSAAPFVLSTPHHSMAWTRSFPDAAASAARSLQTTLARYEQALAAYAEAESSGALDAQQREEADAVYAAYQALVEQYRQLAGEGVPA